MTYSIGSDFPLDRIEGNDCDIVLNIPSLYPMAGATVTFAVFYSSGQIVFKKENADISVNGQVITIPISYSDTLGKSGSHRWEMLFKKANVRTTFARGPFTIIKALLTDGGN